MLVNTPYDDVFKTLANDCRELLIPVVNEAFGEYFIGNEKITFYPNEHFINQKDGKEKERITDTCFEISGEYTKKYHIECQSTEDSNMLIRMFEYDTQIALDNGEIEGNILKVHFPNSAVLYLRSNRNTPDIMHVQMIAPGGELSYPIRVIKMKSYTLEDIFEKKLLFLIPFYIFVHEKELSVYNEEKDRLQELLEEFEYIKQRLETLNEQGVINEFVRLAIIDMTKKVVKHLAKNYKQVQKGVRAVMGGKVLEYEAKTILKKGIAQGLEQGLEQGLQEGLVQGKIFTYIEMIRDGIFTVSEAAKRLDMPVEKLEEFLNQNL